MIEMPGKTIAIITTITGMCTGFVWSSFIKLVSFDQVFDGKEFLLSLLLPLLVSLAACKFFGLTLKLLLPISYLVLLIPLFGLGIGGASLIVMSIGGALGGLLWIGPLLLWKGLKKHRQK